MEVPDLYVWAALVRLNIVRGDLPFCMCSHMYQDVLNCFLSCILSLLACLLVFPLTYSVGRSEVLNMLSLVQMAVLKETDGRGPFASLTMAVVIVKDVIVFTCFAVNIEMADMVRRLNVRCMRPWKEVILFLQKHQTKMANLSCTPSIIAVIIVKSAIVFVCCAVTDRDG